MEFATRSNVVLGKSFGRLVGSWLPEPVFDSMPAPRVGPLDRAPPDVLADDPAGAELDASVRVVHELPLIESIHLRRAHVQAGLRVARPADVRRDDNERLVVRFELVQGQP